MKPKVGRGLPNIILSVGRGEPMNPEVGRGVKLGGGNNLAGAGVGLGVTCCIGLDVVGKDINGENVGSFVWPLYVGL